MKLIRKALLTCLALSLPALGGVSAAAAAQPPVPRPEHPNPQLERADWLNLNGPWEFEYDPGLSGEARGMQKAGAAFSKTINVPFCPESRLSGLADTDFLPCVWYRRTFEVPAAWQGKRVLLHFGAADYDTKVWLDGTLVGEHRGGYTPFVFELTGKVRPGGSVLTVRCADDARSDLQPSGKQSSQLESYEWFYTRSTGIWQTVWLEAVGSSYLRNYKVQTDISSGTATFNANVVDPSAGAVLRATVLADGKKIASATLPAGQTTPFSLKIPQPRLWQISDPFLYDLEFTLERDGKVVDRVKSYFGLREVTVEGINVLLNGRKVFQRLVLDQGYYPEGVYTAPTDADLKRDIEISQAVGFNGARLHQKVFEPRFLYWADRLGYLCWGEYPSWGLDVANPAALERVLPEWLTELERDFNHPSIVMWTPLNETWTGQDPWLARCLHRTTKAIDPTRPVNDCSGFTHVETDIFSVHIYESDLDKFCANFEPFRTGGAPWMSKPEFQAPYSGQPYIVDEYGGVWWNPEHPEDHRWGSGQRPATVEEFMARLARTTGALLGNPRMFGYCYTQLYDVEQEVNGLYTYDRKPKFDPAALKAILGAPAAWEK
ncbi:beta-galactosidase [bacterium]|nr:beta-galactosidase [bacterium]